MGLEEALRKGSPVGSAPIGAILARKVYLGSKFDVHDFRCPENACRAPVMLKGINVAAKVLPYFALYRSRHIPNCEYRDSHGGSGGSGNGSVLIPDQATLLPGALATTTSAPGRVRSSQPPGSLQARRPRLSLRTFICLARTWSAGDLRRAKLQVLEKERDALQLFFRAEWFADTMIRQRPPMVVRYNRKLGYTQFSDMTNNPYIVMGEAVLERGSKMPPRVRWKAPAATFNREVYLPSDASVFAVSRFQNRLDGDCKRVGWGSVNDADCYAIALCLSMPAAYHGIELRLLRSYDDLLILPSGGLAAPEVTALLDVLTASLK